MYTLEDLKEAQKELDRWNTAFVNCRANNPNKYEAQIRDAGIRVRNIEQDLKGQGLLSKSEQEILNDELDRLYPNATSKKIVSYNGQKYQIRYFPLVQSRSRKTVKEWGHRWELLG